MNTKKISVCGKVGSGKSSVVSLLANGMRERGYRVLVVDSDESEPSNNILTQEEIRIADLRPQYIVETDAIGTVFIRKTFQPLEGCASGMGALGREFLKRLRLQKNEVAIVDMEAGIDHFGRSVETTIHSVLIVVEPSFNSLELVNKMNTLAAEFGIDHTWSILNKVMWEEITLKLRDELQKKGTSVIGSIGYDPDILQSGREGRPLIGSRAPDHMAKILDALLGHAKHPWISGWWLFFDLL